MFRRRVAARDKMIRRLQDSTGVLEGQLRLMDEKYIDLRAKLDVSRQQSQKEIRRLHQQADDLYSRLAAAGSVGSRLMRGEGGRQQAPASDPGDASLSSSGALPRRPPPPATPRGRLHGNAPPHAGCVCAVSASAFRKRGAATLAGGSSRRLPDVKKESRRAEEESEPEDGTHNQRQVRGGSGRSREGGRALRAHTRRAAVAAQRGHGWIAAHARRGRVPLGGAAAPAG